MAMDRTSKAFIEVLEGKRASERIQVYTNPAEYSIASSATFKSNNAPGMPSPLVQFVSGNPDTLTLDLYFDTYADEPDKDVREMTEPVRRLTDIDADLHAPPVVRFCWGTSLHFKAVVERVSQKFTMFLADGTPVRATLSVTFKEFRTLAEQLNEPHQESADLTKIHRVIDGDSLWSIAHREYGDVAQWRRIASENDIEDPLLLASGTELRLPPAVGGERRTS